MILFHYFCTFGICQIAIKKVTTNIFTLEPGSMFFSTAKNSPMSVKVISGQKKSENAILDDNIKTIQANKYNKVEVTFSSNDYEPGYIFSGGKNCKIYAIVNTVKTIHCKAKTIVANTSGKKQIISTHNKNPVRVTKDGIIVNQSTTSFDIETNQIAIIEAFEPMNDYQTEEETGFTELIYDPFSNETKYTSDSIKTPKAIFADEQTQIETEEQTDKETEEKTQIETEEQTDKETEEKTQIETEEPSKKEEKSAAGSNSDVKSNKLSSWQKLIVAAVTTAAVLFIISIVVVLVLIIRKNGESATNKTELEEMFI